MQEERTLNVLKSAILLEKRGEVFYRHASEQSENKEVKEFFAQMADDEKQHAEALKEQFEMFQVNKKFSPEVSARYTTNTIEHILDTNLVKLINAASYEAAAISAAINMEKNAVEIYSNRALDASDPEEINLYKWLANWEQNHLDSLIELDKELQEEIWYDNTFWPM